jgi:cysteine synthase
MSRWNNYYLFGAFTLGVILTLGYKDVYPDLEARYRRRRRRPSILWNASTVELKDLLRDSVVESQSMILDGIEGCIGNTPLIKIRSLSEVTGCEILAKAEVRSSSHAGDQAYRISF